MDVAQSALTYTVSADETEPFSTGFPFFGQREQSYDADDAARSAVIRDGEKSYFEVEVEVPAAECDCRIFWKVSSEDDGQGKADQLVLYLNDEVQKTIAGKIDWTEEYLLLPGVENASTAYTLRWSYEKDASGASGSDFAWVDQIIVRTLSEPDFVPMGIALTNSQGGIIESGVFHIDEDKLSVNYTFANIGLDYDSDSVGKALKLSFYLSEDVTLDEADMLLGSIDDSPLGVVDLDSGETFSGSATFDLNDTALREGLYYLIVEADPDATIVESDEENNRSISADQVVELIAKPDLAIAFDDDDTFVGGLMLLSDSIGEVSLTIENRDHGAVVDEHVIALLLQDALQNTPDVLLREFTSSAVLSDVLGSQPTYQFVRTLDAAGAAIPTGRRYDLAAEVDYLDDIPESDENNNTSNTQSAEFVFAELPWQALNSDLFDPEVIPMFFRNGTS